MTISLVRIDDRLIHGQVAFGWTTALGINTILVVNDDAKNDQMKSMALNLAKTFQCCSIHSRSSGIRRNRSKNLHHQKKE